MANTSLNSEERAKIVALTGGIGSGKSTVLTMIEEKGYPVVSADTISREVVSLGSTGLAAVIDYFGADYLLPSGELDRKKLGELIFKDDKKRRALESILHPLIRARSSELLLSLQSKSPEQNKIIIYEVPLYFESGLQYPEVTDIAVVYTPRELAKERLMARDSLTSEQAEQRIRAQMDVEEKRSKADYLIENTSDLKTLEGNVETFLKHLST